MSKLERSAARKSQVPRGCSSIPGAGATRVLRPSYWRQKALNCLGPGVLELLVKDAFVVLLDLVNWSFASLANSLKFTLLHIYYIV